MRRHHPGHGGRAWQLVRQRMLESFPRCAICGRGPVPGNWLEVDHFPVSIEMMQRIGMAPEDQRLLALDPSNLRVIHMKANRSRGGGLKRKSPPRRVSREW